MKKLLSTIALSALVLAACGGEEKVSEPNEAKK